MIFGQDEPFRSAFESTGREFLEKTRDYWLNWVRYLALPYEWQTAVTRAAITLKLCQYEETGAIIAAHTTSIPEAPGSVRNWDYRYCWLRDAFFVVHALNRLGATQTMEDYITYLTNIAVENQDPLQPLHGIVPGHRLHEWIAPNLDGFKNNKPVRVGNAAATQAQHDGYGSVVSGRHPDVRRRAPAQDGRRGAVPAAWSRSGRAAAKYALQPDAGLWEFRGFTKTHTYSATLCWVACDRLARIAKRLGLRTEAETWGKRGARKSSTRS